MAVPSVDGPLLRVPARPVTLAAVRTQFRMGAGPARSAPERRPLMARRPAVVVDAFLALGAIAAAGVGVVMVYTATRGVLLQAGLSPTYYMKRQAVFVLLGIVVMALVGWFDYRKFESFGMAIYGLAIFILLAVMVPHVGSHTLGSERWFTLGPFQLQPSEFAVLGMVIAVATYCARRPDGLTWRADYNIVINQDDLKVWIVQLEQGIERCGERLLLIACGQQYGNAWEVRR